MRPAGRTRRRRRSTRGGAGRGAPRPPSARATNPRASPSSIRPSRLRRPYPSQTPWPNSSPPSWATSTSISSCIPRRNCRRPARSGSSTPSRRARWRGREHGACARRARRTGARGRGGGRGPHGGDAVGRVRRRGTRGTGRHGARHRDRCVHRLCSRRQTTDRSFLVALSNLAVFDRSMVPGRASAPGSLSCGTARYRKVAGAPTAHLCVPLREARRSRCSSPVRTPAGYGRRPVGEEGRGLPPLIGVHLPGSEVGGPALSGYGSGNVQGLDQKGAGAGGGWIVTAPGHGWQPPQDRAARSAPCTNALRRGDAHDGGR